ncbi:MAG TPA: tRNA (adenosine(37)-N6)-threonylcarbamoyltransferase complex ATPase subunit type 1 TsaE [Stellaceae bacterium]|jgi:tRNA threonylcarbamoyladenosine biosynthesis protein TsaE|nr:tRNA (adenosine(37)-N6)-threonylcarbamoyltransferase complex ATPase subunit type 1 TsaE [Stellaceae bacterium]
MPCDPTAPDLTIALADAAATERLGRNLAGLAAPRDVLALHGDLGMGKTTLARAFVRQATGFADEEVPSPTFTLVQTYDTRIGTVWHIDAYRLKHPDEIWELGFEEALADGILVIEWPERLGAHLPQRRLDIHLDAADAGRRARLFSNATDWSERLTHLEPAI